VTQGPEPGRPDEQLSQGGLPADGTAPPGYGLPPGNAAAPPGYGTMPPPPYGGYGTYGGYGAYGGYGRPAAPKPGLIPLRPLTAGEILDGAFTAIRWNPKTILTSSAVVATISGVLVGLVTFFLQRDALPNVSVPASGGTLTPTQVGNLAITTFALLGVTGVVTFFANTILTGLLTVAIGQGALGRKETLGGAWRATRSRIWALFGTVLLAAVFLVLGWALAVGLAVGVGVALGAGAHLPAVGVLVGLLIGGTATVFAVITLVRWTVSIPVVMLEAAGPLTGLRRSWRLVRRSWWRVLGIVLATEVIVGIANAIISVPFGLASGASSFIAPHTQVSIVGVIVSAVGDIVAGTVTAPMLAGVVVLLYTDLRMRREGMDITLQAAAAGEAPGEAGAGGGGQNPGPW
jgi:hypothetical protein